MPLHTQVHTCTCVCMRTQTHIHTHAHTETNKHKIPPHSFRHEILGKSVTCILPTHQLLYHQFDQKLVKASEETRKHLCLRKYMSVEGNVGRDTCTHAWSHAHTQSHPLTLDELVMCEIQLLFAANSHAEDVTCIRNYWITVKINSWFSLTF